MGALGRPERRRRRAALPSWPLKPDPLPCCVFRRLSARRGRVGQGKVERGRRVVDPAWVEAGRPAGEIAPQRQKVRRRPERIADGEAQVAQRRRVGVEAQDLRAGCGAHAGRGAGAASRRKAGRGVGTRRARRGRRRRRTTARPALPVRSPAPRTAQPALGPERLAFPGLSPRSGFAPPRRRNGAGTPSSGSAAGSGTRVEVGANHLAMVNRQRRFVTCFRA